MSSTTSSPRRSAPAGAVVLMILTGLVLSGGVAALAALTRDDHQLLAAGVTALVTLPVSLGLGWALFVSSHTVIRDRNAQDNVETRWLEKAGSQATLDAFMVLGLGAAVFTFVGDRLQYPVGAVLLVAAVLLGVDVAVRYAVLRRRESVAEGA